jgi:hypothetical protein
MHLHDEPTFSKVKRHESYQTAGFPGSLKQAAFLKTGGPAMLRMMSRPAAAGHTH